MYKRQKICEDILFQAARALESFGNIDEDQLNNFMERIEQQNMELERNDCSKIY